MSVAVYPRNQNDIVSNGLFTVRHPWLEELQMHLHSGQPVCLAVPAIAGSLEDWGCWLRDNIWTLGSGVDVEYVPGLFPAALLQRFALESLDNAVEGSVSWAEAILVAYRDRVGDVAPLVIALDNQSEPGWIGLENWLRAQQRTGIVLICPIVVASRPQSSSLFRTVRFGAPQALGNLQSIRVFPDQAPEQWTRLYLLLTALWECGSIPHYAEELDTSFRYGMGQIFDSEFDLRLAQRLEDYSQSCCFAELDGNHPEAILNWARPSVTRLRRLGDGDEKLWQSGVLTWYGPHFDLTPLACRVLMAGLTSSDDQQAIRRRRLTNSPVARWLSAWASTVEESLRLAVLNIGESSFRRYLIDRPSYSNPYRSRWEELQHKVGKADKLTAVDLAEFVDLEAYLGQHSASAGIRGLLSRCRIARNEIIHERVSSAEAIQAVTGVLQWLHTQGLV